MRGWASFPGSHGAPFRIRPLELSFWRFANPIASARGNRGREEAPVGDVEHAWAAEYATGVIRRVRLRVSRLCNISQMRAPSRVATPTELNGNLNPLIRSAERLSRARIPLLS